MMAVPPAKKAVFPANLREILGDVGTQGKLVGYGPEFRPDDCGLPLRGFELLRQGFDPFGLSGGPSQARQPNE